MIEKKMLRASWAVIGCAALSVLPVISASAQSAGGMQHKTLCIFDPVGANGLIFESIKDIKTVSVNWGVTFDLKPYTDERVASEDFKSGVCDAVVLTGVAGRQYNPFMGTLDSLGAIPSYKHLRSALQTLLSEKAAPRMTVGDYEVVGVFPGGASYLYVNDRAIDSVPELSGKRIAVLEADPAQQELVMKIGASPVGANLATMYSKFNNGSVDICAGPAAVYEAMELYKGLQPKGGIVKFPLAQITLQMLTHKNRFPQDFGQKARDYAFAQFDKSIGKTQAIEAKIEPKLWVEIAQADQLQYNEMFRQARLTLRDKSIYDAKMLTVLSRVRCQIEPASSECTAADKE